MLAKLLPLAACATLVWSPAFAQTKCQSPPADMTCRGDMLVWVTLPSKIYHFPGQRYFGCTKEGKFMCQHDADLEGDRPTHNGQ
jgi:hypothetical protein